jgi:hypothetical protein
MRQPREISDQPKHHTSHCLETRILRPAWASEVSSALHRNVQRGKAVKIRHGRAAVTGLIVRACLTRSLARWLDTGRTRPMSGSHWWSSPTAGKASSAPRKRILKSEDLPKHPGIHSDASERSRSERASTRARAPGGAFYAQMARVVSVVGSTSRPANFLALHPLRAADVAVRGSCSCGFAVRHSSGVFRPRCRWRCWFFESRDGTGFTRTLLRRRPCTRLRDSIPTGVPPE